MSLKGTVLKATVWPRTNWRVGNLLGEGACAQVYEVSSPDQAADVEYVAKVAPLPPVAAGANKKRKMSQQEKNVNVLHGEHDLYRGALRGHPAIPAVPDGGYGDDQGVRFLVLQRLGDDLSQIAQAAGGRGLSLALVKDYGAQMLSALRHLHEVHKMVFVDVKPANFMLGRPSTPEANKVFLIDFGLARRYLKLGGAHAPFSEKPGAVEGTPNFLSRRCHGGGSAGRRDDMEALGYVLLFLLGGEEALPWAKAKSDKEGRAIKEGTPLPKLCARWPALADFIHLAATTPFDQAPDYTALAGLLARLQQAGPKAAPAGPGGAAAAPPRADAAVQKASTVAAAAAARGAVGASAPAAAAAAAAGRRVPRAGGRGAAAARAGDGTKEGAGARRQQGQLDHDGKRARYNLRSRG